MEEAVVSWQASRNMKAFDFISDSVRGASSVCLDSKSTGDSLDALSIFPRNFR